MALNEGRETRAQICGGRFDEGKPGPHVRRKATLPLATALPASALLTGRLRARPLPATAPAAPSPSALAVPRPFLAAWLRRRRPQRYAFAVQ